MDHFDLMIEDGDALATWQFGHDPLDSSATPHLCRRIQDHRRAYLDYRGEVSGGRGKVNPTESGTCEVQGQPDAWEVRFRGRRLEGRYRLVALPEQACWQLLPLTGDRPGETSG
mgnify:FL=1